MQPDFTDCNEMTHLHLREKRRQTKKRHFGSFGIGIVLNGPTLDIRAQKNRPEIRSPARLTI